MELFCDVGIRFNDANVSTGLVDTGTGTKVNRVAGTVSHNNCVRVTISNGCTFTIGGFSMAAFDEVLYGSPLVQDLYLSGSTVMINNVSNCAGAVSNGQSFTLNAVLSIETASSNPINFR